MLTHPTGLFFPKTIFRPLRGAGPSNFYTSYWPHELYFQSDLGRRTASSWALPHISSFFNFLISHRISELPWPIATKLCRVIYICDQFIMHVQKFWGPPLKNLASKNMQNFGRLLRMSKNSGGPPLKNLASKNMQNFGRFYTTSDFDANISGTRPDIKNRKDM